MSLFKRAMANARVRAFVGRMVAGYISLVRITGRFQVYGQNIPDQFWDEGRPFILAFWHNRLMLMPLVWRGGVPIDMLISQSRDGDLIARTIAHFGLETIRGSSAKAGRDDKGGTAALRTIVRALAAGRCVGVTPDGPRGPRMRASDGIVAIARLAGVPILPAVAAAGNRLELNTWDRFLVGLPFSRGVLMWGAPIYVPKDCDMNQKRLEIEQLMNDLARAADLKVGCLPIEPASGEANGL